MNLKLIISSMATIIILVASLSPLPVKALHISTTTCSNSCVTTTNTETGVVSIQDCCGGYVTTVRYPHPIIPKAPIGNEKNSFEY